MGQLAQPSGFRTFLFLWGTQSLSVVGSGLTVFAISIWLVQVLYPLPEQRSQLAFALAMLNLAYALPTVFTAPLAGIWADRHDRKRTMMVMDLANGFLSLLLTALILSHMLQLWMLMAFMVLFSTLAAFHGSAFEASYIMIVPERLLPRANGMMQMVMALSGILAPPIAATLIALPALARQGVISGVPGSMLARLADGTALAVTVDAVTFFIAATTLLCLYIPSPSRIELVPGSSERKKSIWSDAKEGAAFIWYRRPLLWLLGTFAVANLITPQISVFLPLIVKFNLASDWSVHNLTFESALAILNSAMGVGGVIGGLIISAWGGDRVKRIHVILASLTVAGLALIGIGVSTRLYLTAGILLVFSAMFPIMTAQSTAIWQTQTPPQLQGRVFSFRRLIAQFTYPLSTIIAGWAGGAFNPGSALAVTGAVLAVFTAAQVLNRQLLHVEDKVLLDELALRNSAGRKATTHE